MAETEQWQRRQRMRLILIAVGLVLWAIGAMLSSGIIMCPMISRWLGLADARPGEVFWIILSCVGELVFWLGVIMPNNLGGRTKKSYKTEGILKLALSILPVGFIAMGVTSLVANLVVGDKMMFFMLSMVSAVCLAEGAALIVMLVQGVRCLKRAKSVI